MAICEHNIQLSIEVDIADYQAKCRREERRGCHTCRLLHICKELQALCCWGVKQAQLLPGEHTDREVITFCIANHVNAHAPRGGAVNADRDTGIDGHVLKMSTITRHQKHIRLGVIGEKEVQATIFVNVIRGDRKRFARISPDAPRFISFAETAIGLLEEELRMRGLVLIRRAVLGLARWPAWEITLRIPLDVARDKDIHFAVSVGIQKHSGCCKTIHGCIAFAGDIDEMPLTIFEQNRVPDACQKDVHPAILVEISRHSTNTVNAFDGGESRIGSYICERAMAIVLVKLIIRLVLADVA